MSSANRLRPAIDRYNGFTVVARPGPRTRAAMIAAAAEMALADGFAEPAEHRGLLMFLRQNNMLGSFGRMETARRYTAVVARATERRVFAASSSHETNDANRWNDLTDTLRPLAGMGTARLIAAAAAFVATADGVVHPGEAELLRVLHDSLELDQAPFDASL